MLTSRAVVLGRILSTGLKSKLAGQNQQIVRSAHGWHYRTGPTTHSKRTMIMAQAVGGFMWWWVLWHMWHESGHVFGEFDYPDVSKWTNAELGIPPDSADDE